jgi:hypothetical protein
MAGGSPWKIGIGLLVAGAALLSGCTAKSTTAEADSSAVTTTAPPSGSSGAGNGTPSTRSLQVSWAANRESGVNVSGGGYRVYYSTQDGFNISGASFVNVPYVSGARSPTTATITGLSPGTHYIKVNAYSSQNTNGSVSSQAAITVL